MNSCLESRGAEGLEVRSLGCVGWRTAPALPNSSLPHVYSRAEIRTLLRATAETQNRPRCVIPARTYGTFLLFLYGTGVLISEAYQLLLNDVDLKRGMVTIRGRAFGRIRIIPIGFDLYRILYSYISFRNRQKNVKADRLFIDKNGRPLQAQTVQNAFQRIRRIAGIGSANITNPPRMHDLRSSFVVHWLSAWHKEGIDLRTMVPALSAYMGQVGLTSTERYLRLTPERFRHQLNLLSPRQGRSHWRDDERLMSFVAQL
jgi:integrase/recombinase XerD